jgi:hypothetical protein
MPKSLTWKQVQKKYGYKDIYLNMSREPFYNWSDRETPEYTIHKTSRVCRENFMTVVEYEDYYRSQGIALHSR